MVFKDKIIINNNMEENQQENVAGGKATSALSKKRYKEIGKAFTERLKQLNLEDTQHNELLENLMKDIATIMNFDEHAKANYNPEYVKKRYEEFKEKATEQGVPVSELNGHKAYYLKNKTEYNRKQAERYRNRKEVAKNTNIAI